MSLLKLAGTCHSLSEIVLSGVEPKELGHLCIV